MPKRRSDASGDSCTRREEMRADFRYMGKGENGPERRREKDEKSIAFLVTAFLLLSCVAMAYAQPLEELVVDVVREEEAESGTSSSVIPNLDETMGVHGVAQGFVDAGGMLREWHICMNLNPPAPAWRRLGGWMRR